MNLTAALLALPRTTCGFWQSLLLGACVTAAAAFGVFAGADGFVHDELVRRSPASLSAAHQQLLLVEVPATLNVDPDINWEALTTSLIKLGARQIVFTSVPAIDGERIRHLQTHPKLLVAGELALTPDHPEVYRFAQVPGLTQPEPLAVAHLPEPVLGIHRTQRYTFAVGAAELPSLEALTARRLGIALPGGAAFLVNFSTHATGFPRMTLQQALEGGVVRDLVQDKVVLIGPAAERFHHNLATPISAGTRQISPLDYHAYALDSLLRDAAISPLSPFASGLVMSGLWLFCFFLWQPMSFRTAMTTAAAIGAGLLACAVAALWFWQVYFALLAPLLIATTTLICVFPGKSQRQDRQLARLASETGLLVTAHAEPREQEPASLDNFWGQALALVDQILPLTRAVLLARPEHASQPTLCEIQALHCQMDAIHERRRDFRRKPYATALKYDTAVEVKHYLKDTIDKERQFLVPLRLAGKVIGFLALGIRRDLISSRSTLLRVTAALSERLSELIAERRGVQTQSAALPRWGQYLRHLHDPRDAATRILTHNVQALGRRLAVLEGMVDSLDTATAVYKPFGQASIPNARMKALLDQANIKLAECSAATLLERLCGMAPDEARGVIISVLFDGHDFERTAHIGATRYLLLVSALRERNAQPGTDDDALHTMHSLMLQLFPMSNVAMREACRLDALEQLAENIRDELSALRPGLQQAARLRLDRITGLIEQAQGPAGTNAQDEPLDLWQTIETAIGLTRANPDYEAVAFNLDGAHQRPTVQAPLLQLRSALVALLQVLAGDTRELGAVNIAIDCHAGRVVVDMHNNGFGMPDEKLQAALNESVLPNSAPLRLIRQLRKTAFGSHGQLIMHSEVGAGYMVRVLLRGSQ